MRSRYTAYAVADRAYLEQTWHPSTRPPDLQLDSEPAPHWQKLLILQTTGGQPGDSEGAVEFLALYLLGGRACQLRESSRFICAEGRWYYLDGTSGTSVGRNAPCPCGSGIKFKRCCGK